MRRAAALMALGALAAGGCGGDDAAPARTSSLVSAKPDPPINALDVDPADGALLLTTNRGFYRVQDGRARRIEATVSSPSDSSPVGRFLELSVVGPGELLGSGHPDAEARLPPYLGLIRSNDGGRSWRVVSRLGTSDLHVIRQVHGRIYAFDAVLPGVIVSRDGGRTWEERDAPREVATDLVVDPGDPATLLLATERELFRSTDEGRTWRPLGPGESPRLAWPGPSRDLVHRVDADGTVRASGNGGQSWSEVGEIDGEPWKLQWYRGRLLVALADGTIVASEDGGKTWDEVFAP